MSARNVIGEISRIHMGPKHPVITHSHIQCQYDCYPDTSEQLFPETWVAAFFVGHHFPASVISSSQLHELIFIIQMKTSSSYQGLFKDKWGLNL